MKPALIFAGVDYFMGNDEAPYEGMGSLLQLDEEERWNLRFFDRVKVWMLCF